MAKKNAKNDKRAGLDGARLKLGVSRLVVAVSTEGQDAVSQRGVRRYFVSRPR
jgi:hypothetical protein